MKTADEYLVQFALDQGLVAPDRVAEARHAAGAGVAGTDPEAGLLAGLAAAGALDRAALTQAVAREFGFACVVLDELAIAPEVLALVPRSFAREHGLVPFARAGRELRVALADPGAVDAIDSLAALTGLEILPALTSDEDIRAAINRYYGEESAAAAALVAPEAGPLGGGGDGPEVEGPPDAREAPVNQRVQSILAEAIRRRASDIHLEPLERRFRVRHRVDGVLLEAEPIPRRWQAAVVSRLKIMANISIAEKRLPQDGRIQVEAEGRRFDLRVSSLPTIHGESLVLRVLDAAGLQLGLPELGFLPDDQAGLERLIASPDGIVLVTGPTGSGKTTTLYSCLHQLNQTDRKIITVEDPVEYQLSGINQVPVNAAIGMTYAAALRAMLRQSPNIVMVGEIRDRETAEIALNAALTGHLVFSTLHTNDATAAVARLVDIGAKPFLVAAALRASLAQRLVRRNCPHCRRTYMPADRERRALGLTATQIAGAEFARGTGCAACHGTGYLGRLGIFEIFFVTDEIRALVYDRASASRLRRAARQSGLRTMREDAVRKVLAGLTTIEEVVAVTVGDEP